MDILYQGLYHNITIIDFLHVCQPLLLNLTQQQRNIARYLATLISIHIPYWNSHQLTRCVEHSTKCMITILDAMFIDAIDLWWRKIPPTYPSFVLMKIRRKILLKKEDQALRLKSFACSAYAAPFWWETFMVSTQENIPTNIICQIPKSTPTIKHIVTTFTW